MNKPNAKRPADLHAATQPSSYKLLLALTLTGMLSGLLVVLVYQYTKPLVEQNKREAIAKAIFRVVPGATRQRNFLLSTQGLVPAEQKGAKGEAVYAGYDDKGQLRGVAIEAAAQGYQDTVRILYGYRPSCRCITGIKVLKMAETPGLGDRIDFDPGFQKNFKALDARLATDRQQLAHAIVTVKHGSKNQPWQIDAISGATISSKAVGRMLNRRSQAILPLLNRFIDVLRNGGKP